MFRIQQKQKFCEQAFIKWRKKEKGNAGEDIKIIQKEMETMQLKGVARTERDGNNTKHT